MQHIFSLVVWIAVSAAAGVVGAIASIDAATFYSQLERPSWAPPAWLFGPVWTVLYLLMGIAAWLVWRRRETQRVGTPLALFIAQLAANALWSWLFFAWHRGAWAFADIVALLVLVAATVVAFARVRRAAGVLMVPYLAWLAYAGVLNLWVWRANPALLGT
jgi:tryptophan-rich sensory protein